MDRRAFLSGASAFVATPALAEMRVSVAIVLAVDISSSIDYEHWLLQRRGYVQAFMQPEVLHAIMATPRGKIALTYFEWSGMRSQRITVPWTIIGCEEEAQSVAEVLYGESRPFEGPTGVGSALAYAEDLLGECPFQMDSKVIDVSGDGANNDGPPPEGVRDRCASQGIRINGIPIEWSRSHPPSGMTIEEYYRNSVVGGPNAFCMKATSFQTFGYAIAAKLRQEVA